MRIIETNDDDDEDATVSNNNKGASSVVVLIVILLLSRSIEMMCVKAWLLRVCVYTLWEKFYSPRQSKEREMNKKLFRVL